MLLSRRRHLGGDGGACGVGGPTGGTGDEHGRDQGTDERGVKDQKIYNLVGYKTGT